MWKQTLLKPGEKDQRKFQALGGVQGHQRHAGIGIELVGIGGQCRVIEKFSKSLAAGFGVVGGVGQFLQIFNAAERLRRTFRFESLDVAGAIDEKSNQLWQSGSVAGSSEWRCFRRSRALSFWLSDFVCSSAKLKSRIPGLRIGCNVG